MDKSTFEGIVGRAADARMKHFDENENMKNAERYFRAWDNLCLAALRRATNNNQLKRVHVTAPTFCGKTRKALQDKGYAGELTAGGNEHPFPQDEDDEAGNFLDEEYAFQ